MLAGDVRAGAHQHYPFPSNALLLRERGGSGRLHQQVSVVEQRDDRRVDRRIIDEEELVQRRAHDRDRQREAEAGRETLGGDQVRTADRFAGAPRLAGRGRVR